MERMDEVSDEERGGRKSPSRSGKKDLVVVILAIMMCIGLLASYSTIAVQNSLGGLHVSSNVDILIPMEPYPESAWRTPSTLSTRVVASTPFARFEIHKVLTESGEVVNDWLWTDERSHVNILVHLKNEDKYLLFHQKKYGLSEPAYATVGGLFNEGETAEECATRELLEETGLVAEELISLGSYRVQVNRGGGVLHAFLARNCISSHVQKKSDDYEKQDVRKLTRQQLIEVALKGEIGEAQWAATVALGILHDVIASPSSPI